MQIPLSMVWYSEELAVDLADEIKVAIKYMRKKYSIEANVVYLNPLYAEQVERIGGIRLVLTKQVAAGQLFVGREE